MNWIWRVQVSSFARFSCRLHKLSYYLCNRDKDLVVLNTAIHQPKFLNAKIFLAMAFEITDANFQQEVLDRDGVSVIDFWAEWCGPCRMIAPIIDKLAAEYKGKVLVGKMNVDHNQEVPMKYGIRSIPTVIVIKNGKEVAKQVGVTTHAKLAEIIDKQLAAVTT
jgi:thioredoxin 1